jgi:isopenicillin-N N-acyltransferase-like protein
MKREPMPVYDLKGTYYEIGRQFGDVCKDGIKETVQFWVDMIKGFYPEVTKESLVSMAEPFIEPYKNHAPELIDEMKGISESSGVSFNEILMCQTAPELLCYFPKLQKVGGCTSFAAAGSATKDGKTITGQNWDWTDTCNPILIRVQPEGGVNFLALTLAGMFGICGINSAGIGHQANLIITTNSQVGVPPYGGIHQKVLAQKNLADIVGVLFLTMRASADNFLMASAEGDIIDVEITPDDMEVLYPQNDIIVHANHLLTDRFRSADIGAAQFPDCYLRIARLRKLMDDNHGKLSADLMKKLLTDHNDYPDSICRHIDKPDPPATWMTTRASMICVPGEQKMYVANGNPCENEYIEYKL